MTDQIPNPPTEPVALAPTEVGWRGMDSAPKDGTYIIARAGSFGDRWGHLNGRAFVIRHEGHTASGFDLGWSVYPGFGGAADWQFACWTPVPPPDNTPGVGGEGDRDAALANSAGALASERSPGAGLRKLDGGA